jgi:hypothetical protein
MSDSRPIAESSVAGGALGASARAGIATRFTNGTITPRPRIETKPASAARRTLIDTPIHRNASPSATSAQPIQSGVPSRIRTRVSSRGLRNWSGVSQRPVLAQMTAPSIA